jgi:hypothetical protein
MTTTGDDKILTIYHQKIMERRLSLLQSLSRQNLPQEKMGQENSPKKLEKQVENPQEKSQEKSQEKFQPKIQDKSQEKSQEKRANPPQGKKSVKLCLNMIVRDEESNILRCFKTVRHLIDIIAIVDTGSLDKTIEIIKDYGEKENLPTLVSQEKWIDEYDVSRNQALDLGAKLIQTVDPEEKYSWYYVFIDADDQCFGPDGSTLYNGIGDGKGYILDKNLLTADMYHVIKHNGDKRLPFPWLIRYTPDQKIRWKDFLHEFPAYVDGSYREPITLHGGYVLRGFEGFRSKDPYTFLKDAHAFLKGVQREPKNHRYMYYAGNSFRDANQEGLAETCYKKAITMGLTGDNRYQAYMTLGVNRYNRFYNRYWSLKNSKKPSNHEHFNENILTKQENKMISYFQSAYETVPARLDAPYYLLLIWRMIGKHVLAWNFSFSFLDSQGNFIPRPYEHFYGALSSIHEYKFEDELSLAAWHVGKMDIYRKIATPLVAKPKIPEDLRKRVENELKKYSKP